MAGGRPLKFKDVADLQSKIEAYFAECDPHWVDEEFWEHPRDNKGKLLYDSEPVQKSRKVKTKQIPYTITGLALALETTRETLLDYESGKYDDTDEDTELTDEQKEVNAQIDQFSDTIKRAKTKCHEFAEKSLYGGNAAGPIFNLKNNYGWKDKTEQDITSDGESLIPIVRIIDERPRDTNTK